MILSSSSSSSLLISLSQLVEEKVGFLQFNPHGNRIELLSLVPAHGKEAEQLLKKKNKNPLWILFHNHKNFDFPSYHDVLVMLECDFRLQVITTPKGYYVIEIKKKIPPHKHAEIIFHFQELYPSLHVKKEEKAWVEKWNLTLNEKGLVFYFIEF